MHNADRKKLDRVERALCEALALVQELRSAEREESSSSEKTPFDGKAAVGRCRELGRRATETYLAELKQNELGAVFAAAGGPSIDKRKPKQWLIAQILWRVFDFESGHNAIRGIGSVDT